MSLILSELSKLGLFLFEFSAVYIPCVLGTICGMHFTRTHTKGKTKKKPKLSQAFAKALSSSILPALIVLLCEVLLPDATKSNINFIFKYGIAMLLGFIGADKVTEYLSNLSNTFKIMKAISEGKSGLLKLSEEMCNDDNNNDDDDNE